MFIINIRCEAGQLLTVCNDMLKSVTGDMMTVV